MAKSIGWNYFSLFWLLLHWFLISSKLFASMYCPCPFTSVMLGHRYCSVFAFCPCYECNPNADHHNDSYSDYPEPKVASSFWLLSGSSGGDSSSNFFSALCIVCRTNTTSRTFCTFLTCSWSLISIKIWIFTVVDTSSLKLKMHTLFLTLIRSTWETIRVFRTNARSSTLSVTSSIS